MADFLSRFVSDFAEGLRLADAKRPQAHSHRDRKPYKIGIGPHTEAQTIGLVTSELRARYSTTYEEIQPDIPYANSPRQKCDLLVKAASEAWYVEVKMMRLMGDNGKPNDNILTHLLSPYPQHRSALTDCQKLIDSGFEGYKGILIYGYSYPEWPLSPTIEAFELLARAKYPLGKRFSASFSGLCHPIHQEGGVFAWNLE